MDKKERRDILAAMVELHMLLTAWGVALADYFFVDRIALRLQDFDVPLNARKRLDFCVSTLMNALPWFSSIPQRGFQEVPPPVDSPYNAAVNDFTDRRGFEVHFYSMSEAKYRWRQEFVRGIRLPNGVEVRLNNLYGTIRGLGEDMLPYCNDAGVGYEKGIRMLRFIEDIRAIALDNGDVPAQNKADDVLREFSWIREKYEAFQRAAASSDGIHGATAFPGVVRGDVFVVRDILSSIPTTPCIIVTDKVTPAFYRYKTLMRGLVVDHGGITSHAAILARECKIPTIVGALVATERLKTGDAIELDATHGVVRPIV